MDRALKVLFVDDERVMLEGYKHVLSKKALNWDVRFCMSSKEALGLLSEGDYDVLVTDMVMPELSGVEMMEEVKRRSPQTVRIALSGYDGDKYLLDTVKLAHQYLKKPFVPEQLVDVVNRTFRVRRFLHEPKFEKLVGKLDSIPSMPNLYVELMGALRDEHVSLDRVEGIIMEDLGMSAKLLSVANSPFFGVAHEVSSVKEAISVMGIGMIKSMILGAGLFECMDKKVMKYLPMQKFWEHALYTGLIARTIAEEEGAKSEEVEACFMAGLLHTVGVVVLATNFPEEYRVVYENSIREGLPLYVIEEEQFDASYMEIGGYLLSMWGLATSIVEAVTFSASPAAVSELFSLPILTTHVASEIAKNKFDQGKWFVGRGIDWEYLRSLGYRSKVVSWLGRYSEGI